MTQITPWPDIALRARELLRVLDRNDGVCLKRELDHVGRSLEPGPELSSLEAERSELFECIIEDLRGADPLTGPGGTKVGIHLLKHLAGSCQHQQTPASLKRAGRRPRRSPDKDRHLIAGADYLSAKPRIAVHQPIQRLANREVEGPHVFTCGA